MSNNPECIKFFIDPTVLRLGKWLRYLGLDSPFASSGRELHADGYLLTRKRGKKSERVVFVPSDRIDAQLRWFAERFPEAIDSHRVGSRCIRCNRVLVSIDREAVRDCVPDYIYQSHATFKVCPGCQKIYWKGSHPERMRAFLEKAQAWNRGGA